MMRSLYSGVSGLRNHQQRMDVIGNNIANVNTVGYKKSRVIFQDLYSQTTKGASAPRGEVGGTNAMQIGLGVSMQAIDVLHTPSAAQNTGSTFDMMINGDGYFIVDTPQGFRYTRAGNFLLDKDFNLVTAEGYKVYGIPVENPNASKLKDPAAGANKAYDKGELVPLKIEDPNHPHDPDDPDSTISFVSVDDKGMISGTNGLGEKVFFGAVGVTTFSNAQGLEKCGNNLYQVSSNTGDPVYNVAQSGNAGTISSGRLEMSNVDLSEEFTDMIVTQRGFQANSRVITVSDTLLEELINLKR